MVALRPLQRTVGLAQKKCSCHAPAVGGWRFGVRAAWGAATSRTGTVGAAAESGRTQEQAGRRHAGHCMFVLQIVHAYVGFICDTGISSVHHTWNMHHNACTTRGYTGATQCAPCNARTTHAVTHVLHMYCACSVLCMYYTRTVHALCMHYACSADVVCMHYACTNTVLAYCI